MAFVPTPNTAQIEIVYLWDGQICENVLHYEKEAGSVTPTELAALADVVREYVHDTLLPLMSDTLQLLRIVARMIDVVDGILAISTTGLPAAGGGGSAALPNNVSIAFSWRTGTSGRSFRGRSFIPGLQEGQVTANALTSGANTAYAAAMAGLRLVASEDGWTMVIVSKVADGAPRTTGVTTPVTSGFFVDGTIDSMRRRLPGRGS